MKNPHVKTELPGPKARALIARDALVVSPSYPRDYPFVMSHGRGAEVWDVDGNRFLDFAAGIAVCSTGHSHPAVVAAISEAAARFLHISSDFWHEGQVRLAERINESSPLGEPMMSFFAQSGTESVEGALKLARYVTGRPRFIGFLGGFHGRTMGSLAFTSSKYTQQKGFFPTMPGVTHVPFPNPFRPLLAGADQGQAVLRYIEDVLFAGNVPAGEVAGILVEPIQGEGGYLVPPDGFLAGLRSLCDRHGILLIFDEVQSGIGRTGTMFACQQWGVVPDIMTLAKGLGSGLPIGMVVAKKSIMEVVARRPREYLWGKPAVLRGGARHAGAGRARIPPQRGRGRRVFHAAAARPGGAIRRIGEVRGRGLMIGVELVADRGTKAPARRLCDALITRAFHNGLLLLSCGASTVRFMPPLMIDRGHRRRGDAPDRNQPGRGAGGRGRSLSEAVVPAQHGLQRCVRQGDDPVALEAGHVLGRDHCIDHGFLGRLHGRLEQRIELSVRQHLHRHRLICRSGFGIGRREGDEYIAGAVAGDAAVAAQAQGHATRDPLELNAEQRRIGRNHDDDRAALGKIRRHEHVRSGAGMSRPTGMPAISRFWRVP